MKILYLENNADIEEFITNLGNLHNDASANASAVLSVPFDHVLLPVPNLDTFIKGCSWGRLASGTLKEGSTVVNTSTKEVFIGTKSIILSKTEYDILTFLMTHSPGIVSKDMLLNKVWHDYGNIMSNTVEVHIYKLRAKIGKDKIVCIKGFGYKFVKN